MRKSTFLLLIMTFLNIAVTANAAWIVIGVDSQGNRLIYDDDLDITWYDFTHDPNIYAAQVEWASELSVNFNGITLDDWRLPETEDGPDISDMGHDGTTSAGYNNTSGEMGHLYYLELGNLGKVATDGTDPQPGWGLNNTGPFQNLQDGDYWSSTLSAEDNSVAWTFDFSSGLKSTLGLDSHAFAMAVRDGDIRSTPAPGAFVLTGIGISVVGLLRRRTRVYC